MLYVMQMALYCLLLVVLVKCVAGNSGLNCLYFYPKAYIDEAQKRGIADKDAVMKKGYPIHGAVLYRHGDRAGRHHLPLEPGDGLQDGLCAVLSFLGGHELV